MGGILRVSGSNWVNTMSFAYTADQLRHLVQFSLAEAKRIGGTDAAADVSESVGLSVSVRCGEIETIENNRDKSFGITVYQGQRRGHAASSDFSESAIATTVKAAYDIARFTAEDEFAGLPEVELLEMAPRDLDLYHPWKLSADNAVTLAKKAEAAAMDYDKHIRNSDGAGVSTETGQFIAANTRGFSGGYPYSRHSFSVSPIAQLKKGDNSTMQRDYWYSTARRSKDLADPKAVGIYAAQRALARLNARTIQTQQCPVLFEAPLAAGILGGFVQAVSGSALYRKSSFLLDMLGKPVFADHLSVHEDPFTTLGMGSSPFDEEGVKTRARQVVTDGILEGYFLSCYSARKLGMTTTGNAGGSHNLTLTSKHTQKADTLAGMVKKMHRGLLVTELMGQGVNYVTGDYSRGAFGYWVENGEIAYPVEEITIAGNLKDMLRSIVAVGNDTLARGTKITGSLLIEGMTLASGAISE
jgi:PmbA protein